MICILTASFNARITDEMQRSAVEVFDAAGEAYEITRVPDALQLPVVAQRWIRSRRPDVILALACVVRGSTGRYDFVVRTCVDALARVALEGSTPIVPGILACPDRSLAWERRNCGAQYAQSVLEMKKLFAGPRPDPT